MFKVKCIKKLSKNNLLNINIGDIVNVYSVEKDEWYGLVFLVYAQWRTTKDYEWVFVPASDFEPVEYE